MDQDAEKRALTFILATMFIDSLGSGIAVPVMPTLIAGLSGGPLAEAAQISGWMMGGFALAQLLTAPVLGKLSDAYGRRPVLLLCLFAFGVDCLLMGWAPTLTWLIVARVISGAFCASGPIASAYMTDITQPEMRAKRFGLLTATWGLGIFIGPAAGGLLGALDPKLPFYAAGGLTLLNVLGGAFVLRESLAKENRRPFVWKGSDPVAAVMGMIRYPAMKGFLLALLSFQIAYLTSPCIWPFFTTERFHWSVQEIGWSLAGAGLAVTVVQALVLGKLIDRLGEAKTAMLGFGAAGLSFIGLALATSSWMICVLILPYALGTIGMATLRSLMSKAVPKNAQGELQGVIGSIGSLAGIGTPVVMSAVFKFATADGGPVYFPGAPYLIGGLMALLSLTVIARTKATTQLEVAL